MMYHHFLKLINTLIHKWFYILASCFIPLTLISVGTGQDIVAILAEGNLKHNTIYLSFGMMLLGVTIWMLPSIPLSFYAFFAKRVLGYRQAKRGLVLKVNLFKSIYKDYNGDKTNDYVKYKPALASKTLALLPWILLNIQILNFYLSEKWQLNCAMSSVVTVLFLIILYVINYLAEKAIRSRLFNHKLIAALIVFLPLVAIYFIVALFNESGFAALLGYMVSNYIVFNFIILYLDLKLELHSPKQKLKSREILKRINYLVAINIAVIASTFVFLTILSFKAFALEVTVLSGVVLLVFGIIPYILFVDNIFSALRYAYRFLSLNYEKNLKTWRILSVAVMSLFLFGCWLLFVKNNNSFHKDEDTVRKNYPHLQTENYSLTKRFDKFYEGLDSLKKSEKDSVNVFLISGQGGGSRAAACFLNIMLNADSKNLKWYKHIFSISTISGSSAGAMQYFYLHQLPEQVLTKMITDTSVKDFSAEIVKSCYSYNYMNSNFLGLLYYDRLPVFMKTRASRKSWVNRAFCSLNIDKSYKQLDNAKYFCAFNRNYIQEEEERRALLTYINSFITKKSREDSVSMNSFYENIAQNCYTYTNLIKDSSVHNPLYIMNTTMLSRGRKGYFTNANIDVNPNWTNLAFTNPYISMHSASIASQSVPILNTFYETYETALCDGGFYENSGTSTTYDIYKQLRAYCAIKKYKVRFILVNIYNQTESVEPKTYSKSAFITTVKGLFAQIFNGHEKDALENIKRSTMYFNATQDNGNDTIINFNLNYSVATTRSLRKATLDTILKRSIDSAAILYLASIIDTKKVVIKKSDNLQTSYIIYPQTIKGNTLDLNKKFKDCDLLKELNVQTVEFIDGKYGHDIRYYHAEDAAMALRIKTCLDKSGAIFEIKDLSQTTFKNMVKPHTIEIWYK